MTKWIVRVFTKDSHPHMAGELEFDYEVLALSCAAELTKAGGVVGMEETMTTFVPVYRILEVQVFEEKDDDS